MLKISRSQTHQFKQQTSPVTRPDWDKSILLIQLEVLNLIFNVYIIIASYKVYLWVLKKDCYAA